MVSPRCLPAQPQPRPGEVESIPALCSFQGRWRQLCWASTFLSCGLNSEGSGSLLHFCPSFPILTDWPTLSHPPQCSLETIDAYVGIYSIIYYICMFLEITHIICLDLFILAMSDYPMFQASAILESSAALSYKRSSQCLIKGLHPERAGAQDSLQSIQWFSTIWKLFSWPGRGARVCRIRRTVGGAHP